MALGQQVPLGESIVVQDIVYDQGAETRFVTNSILGGPDSVIWGNAALFEFQHTWDYVRITNASDRQLVLNLIDVVLEGGSHVIEVHVNDIPGHVEIPEFGTSLSETDPGVTFEFDIEHTFPATQVEIHNSGDVADSNVMLAGRIENPIGHTQIHNERGDILTAPNSTHALIRTNVLERYTLGSRMNRMPATR
jgi:hypothetical protein